METDQVAGIVADDAELLPRALRDALGGFTDVRIDRLGRLWQMRGDVPFGAGEITEHEMRKLGSIVKESSDDTAAYFRLQGQVLDVRCLECDVIGRLAFDVRWIRE